MVNSPVLVLNQNYEPLNVCQARRAFRLIYQGKAELLENGRGELHSASTIYPLPSVIRLVQHIKRPIPQRRLTRVEVFNRDEHRCQYCGKESRNLTLDHVMPRFRGGMHTWNNIVSACVPCNRHKAGRTPAEAGMKLLKQPVAPHHNGFYIPYQYLKSQSQWLKFLPLDARPA